jgi:hypothetical protein
MADMNCMEFESLVGDYVGRDLQPEVKSRFAEHSLRCQDCRKLLDDIRGKLSDPETAENTGGLHHLDAGLESIPELHGSLDCWGFQELVTEFLDGFVPAPVYHRFVSHSDECADCSRILTGVVYAVAFCHSVHMNEELEVPSDLNRHLLDIAFDGKSMRAGAAGLGGGTSIFGGSRPDKWYGKLHRAARSMVRALPPNLPRLATASSLVAASLAMLFFGSVKEMAWLGIYRRAQVRVAGVYNQTADVQFTFEQMKSDIGQAWKTVGTGRVGALADGDPSALTQSAEADDQSGSSFGK